MALRSHALLPRQYDDRKVLVTTVDAWGRALWLLCPTADLEPNPYGRPRPRPRGYPYEAVLVISEGKDVRERVLRDVTLLPSEVDALPNGRFVLQGLDPQGERNARIYGRDGRMRHSFAMGAVVEFMMADRRNNLWSAYGDEGVYSDPISAAGLVRWDSGGNRQWAYTAPRGVEYIDSVYALNVTDTVAWATYYPTFPLLEVRANGRFHLRKNPVGHFWGMAVRGDRILTLGGGPRERTDTLHHLLLTERQAVVVGEARLTMPNGAPFRRYARPVGRGERLYLRGRSARQWYVVEV
ncbi:hypothetical protein ACIP98_07435 [Streptomyces sp. NPDC088354]|uniref:hypothetical protein n=1 Tax=unclassified Streptomyces TaxID=2593676 RepID=UPI0029AB613E|nr:hypothetical protein [Streptomyces sp. MI02-7b]MDX3071439.1 hypothetical protein [Streptomyces sp. MI02-7b]